jgi:hypothetical protein
LPFDHWSGVIREAQNWGLLSPDPAIPRFLRLQPIFPYFLRNRLHEPEQAEVKSAIETAFREHYDEIGDMLMRHLLSKDPQERRAGQVLTYLEYENLVTALNLALAAMVSIYSLYGVLTNYLDTTQDQQRGSQLGRTVLAYLETYPPEKLTGRLEAEFARFVGDTAIRQLRLKHYDEAEALHQKKLKLVLQLEDIDEKERGMMKATTYHNLGRVAEDQRQWAQARDYFLRALETYVEYNDAHNGGIALRSLARLWQSSNDASLPTAVANVLGTSVEETEKLLPEMLGNELVNQVNM